MNVQKVSSFLETPPLFHFYFESIFSTISQLDNEYPSFCDWYHKKILNGIIEKKREIFFCIVQDYIAGISIVKKDGCEKKICTFRVQDRFQCIGIGKRLMIDSFDFLNTQFPLITVSDKKEHQFKKIFSYFGFKKYSILDNYYRNKSSEISYNDMLR